MTATEMGNVSLLESLFLFGLCKESWEVNAQKGTKYIVVMRDSNKNMLKSRHKTFLVSILCLYFFRR